MIKFYSCNMLYYCLKISAGMNVHFPHSNYNYATELHILHCIPMHYIACSHCLCTHTYLLLILLNYLPGYLATTVVQLL